MWKKFVLLNILFAPFIECHLIPENENIPAGLDIKIDPVKTDPAIDNQLFAQFMSILGNFINVMINRNDTTSTKFFVTKIVEDIVTTARLVTRTKTHKHQKADSLKKAITGALKYLAHIIEQQKKSAAQVIPAQPPS